MFDLMDDTIVAVASPPGMALRGIVRCAGPEAISLAEKVFSPASVNSVAACSGYSRIQGLVHIEAECDVPGELYLFRAPQSYTRQHGVEFHVQGSPVLLGMLVERLMDLGARAAEPGEFTARAFLSGAMDLVRAEAVAAVIRSRSDAQLRAAHRLSNGELTQRIEAVLEEVAELVALVEADIDFAEEPIEFITPSTLTSRLNEIESSLRSLLNASDSTERADVLPRILLVGRSNAGKSTLMNALSGVDRAICSAVAGTTRDLLSAPVRLAHGEAILLDAAGVDAEMERLGTAAAAQTLAAASEVDLLCCVVDLTSDSAAPVALECQSPQVVVGNKTDLLDEASIESRMRQLEDSGVGAVCAVSAKTGEGIEACRRLLADTLAMPENQGAGDAVLLTARHRQAVESALVSLKRCADEAAELNETIDRADLIAFELREAMEALGSISGSVTTDDLLGRVFSSFCIGK